MVWAQRFTNSVSSLISYLLLSYKKKYFVNYSNIQFLRYLISNDYELMRHALAKKDIFLHLGF